MRSHLINGGYRLSKLYRPSAMAIPAQPPKGDKKTEPQSKSQKLLIDNGIISSSSSPGSFHLLPLGVRSIEKINRIVDSYLGDIGCQKIQMPILTSTSLWKISGRYEEARSELMQVKDRQSKDYILGPTHEEAISEMVGSTPLSHKLLPLRLYQTSTKFRDEMRPRFGLIRAREFIMTDLYSFDMNSDHAKETYTLVNTAFGKIFDSLGVSWTKVLGDSALMGGELSEEYHYMSELGEDHLKLCSNCGVGYNQIVLEEGKLKMELGGSTIQAGGSSKCKNCGNTTLEDQRGIEIAHSFLLGKKYTSPLKTKFTNRDGKPGVLEMGCYGIGVSRLLGASIEATSSGQEIRWAKSIAPFLASIIIPKAGSKEETASANLSERICSRLAQILPDNVLVDDRTDLTIGRRVTELKRLGIPYLVILGKGVKEDPPQVEVQERGATEDADNCSNMSEDQLYSYFNELAAKNSFLDDDR